MKMTVIRHWPQDTAFDGSIIPARDDPSTGESDWESVEEMQRELLRRFQDRDPVKIENGIRYNKPEAFGITYTVTLRA